MPAPRRSSDLPPPLGVTLTGDGAEVAVFAGHAEGVELCLDDDRDPSPGGERRVELTDRADGIWFGHVPGVRAGQRYGFRVHGAWQPEQGLRHNPDKLLLDPYARAVDAAVTWQPEVFGHVVDDALRGDGETRDTRDSAAYVPRSVVVGDGFDWGDDRPPMVPWADTVVYEAHVRGLTMRHPDVPEHLRGTYAGLAHPAVVEHLTRLGVTTVELLPAHTFTSEPHLARRGLVNYWGYNTLGFFAPHAAYASVTEPQGVVDEVKSMVKALHAAGIEVVLDVVYNHTAEQSGDSGATLSWRGLDNRAYYRLDERGRDVDVTGCGNTVDLRHPVVCQLVLDSLRHWVTEYHVDGFRFDLAVALARGGADGHGDFTPDHPFLAALRTDPVLSRVKLIAEPWDVGMHGWRTGQFPPPFAEWNDRFRDTVRTFWLPDVARAAEGRGGSVQGGHRVGHGVRELATRLAGSQDLFGHNDRGPIASVNFVTAHDGFTLADLTAYERKHNEANGEDNRDGHGDNRSWNHGVEGPTDDPAVLARRQRSMRNLLATTLLGAGVPMLTAGDETGRTQRGNNNAYCQDNDISWVDWELAPWQEDLAATAAFLTRLRAEHPVLRERRFFTEHPVPGDGRASIRWFDAAGQPMDNGAWESAETRTLAYLIEDEYVPGTPPAHDRLLVVLHGGASETSVVLPSVPDVAGYQLVWDSADEQPRPAGDRVGAGETVAVVGLSVRVYDIAPT